MKREVQLNYPLTKTGRNMLINRLPASIVGAM